MDQVYVVMDKLMDEMELFWNESGANKRAEEIRAEGQDILREHGFSLFHDFVVVELKEISDVY